MDPIQMTTFYRSDVSLQGVGLFLAELARAGQAEDTLVIFRSQALHVSTGHCTAIK